MNAKELNRITMKKLEKYAKKDEKKARKKAEKIIKSAKRQARLGWYCYQVDGIITPDIEKILEEKGFVLDTDSKGNRLVKWREPTQSIQQSQQFIW